MIIFVGPLSLFPVLVLTHSLTRCFQKDDAIAILGENHMAVIKSAHRAEYTRYQEALSSNEQQRGGIMSGSGVSNESSSIFSSSQNGENDSNDDGSDPLSMLEQGAASYDGSVPLPIGDADDDGDGTVTITSSQQSRAKASAK